MDKERVHDICDGLIAVLRQYPALEYLINDVLVALGELEDIKSNDEEKEKEVFNHV